MNSQNGSYAIKNNNAAGPTGKAKTKKWQTKGKVSNSCNRGNGNRGFRRRQAGNKKRNKK